jgi:hypothetical protein
MPVSKKRKKEGKKVQRQVPEAAEHPEGHPPAEGAGPPQQRMGRPTNPFVTQRPRPFGSQRGR